MLALEMRQHLRELQAERLLVAHDAPATEVDELDFAIAAATNAYVLAAVTDIATLRAELFGPQLG